MSYRFHYKWLSNSSASTNLQSSLPVVFLHGFLGSSEDFEAIAAQLSHEFCCLMIDLPGHGQTIVSGVEEQYTMPRTAEAIVALLDHLQISQSFLVGYSMGGRLALYLALHYPHRFPKVVLESASPGLENESDRQRRHQHDCNLAAQLEANFSAFLERWYSQPLFQSLRQHPEFAAIQNRRSHNRPTELALSLRHLSTGKQPSLWRKLEQFTNPLLLIVGAHDRKFCDINQAMSDRCASACLTIVSTCGHAVHLEDPITFEEQVRSFFQQPDAEDSPVAGRRNEYF
ncbi:MAG TPA: 2-succinyl-6-hydroxy-2,4-cyclohexadiene-1-carboxylate synthase [Thermosynechococcaceae cyanobacterium]